MLSFLYSPSLTTIHNHWKNYSLNFKDLVDKVMSLLFKMLSRLVITFHPRSKHLLISWLQSPSSVILEPRKIKSLTVSTVSPSTCHEVMGLLFSILFIFFSCGIYAVIFILSFLCIIISIFLLLVIILIIRIHFHTLLSNKKTFRYPTHPTNTESYLFLQSNPFFLNRHSGSTMHNRSSKRGHL